MSGTTEDSYEEYKHDIEEMKKRAASKNNLYKIKSYHSGYPHEIDDMPLFGDTDVVDDFDIRDNDFPPSEHCEDSTCTQQKCTEGDGSCSADCSFAKEDHMPDAENPSECTGTWREHCDCGKFWIRIAFLEEHKTTLVKSKVDEVDNKVATLTTRVEELERSSRPSSLAGSLPENKMKEDNGFKIGDKVEVFSKLWNKWVPGTVERVDIDEQPTPYVESNQSVKILKSGKIGKTRGFYANKFKVELEGGSYVECFRRELQLLPVRVKLEKDKDTDKFVRVQLKSDQIRLQSSRRRLMQRLDEAERQFP